MTSEIMSSFKIKMKKETKHSTISNLIAEWQQDTEIWHNFHNSGITSIIILSQLQFIYPVLNEGI